MSRAIVKQKNNMYALWSTIVDDFILLGATAEEVITEEINDPNKQNYPGGQDALRRDLCREFENIAATGKAWPWAPTWNEALSIISELHSTPEKNMNEQSDSSHCSAAVHCMESSNDVLTVIYDTSGNAFTHDGLCMFVNDLVRENQRLRKKVAEIHYDSDRYREERDAAQHFIIETGAIPGIDCECRCDQCVKVAQRMERAGYLADDNRKWWDS